MNLYLVDELHQLLNKNAVEPVTTQKSLGFYNSLYNKIEQLVETYISPQYPEQVLKTDSFTMETPEAIRTSLQPGEELTSTDFKDAYFYIPNQGQSRKYITSRVLPVHSSPNWSVHSTQGGYSSGEGGQMDSTTNSYKYPPVPKRLVIQSQNPPNQSPAYTNSGSYLSGVRLVVQHGEFRTGLQASFRLIGYRFDLKESRVRPTLEGWQILNTKIQKLFSGLICPVW